MYVTDAVGGRRRSRTARGSSGCARRRRAEHGARRWSPSCSATGPARSPAPAREVIHWYFPEVPKLTAEVGVAEARSRRGGRASTVAAAID